MGNAGEHAQAKASGLVKISAVTLATADMAGAVGFYRALGFEVRYGGEAAEFTSFRVGDDYLNLYVDSKGAPEHLWGRIIIYVSDVDAFYRQVCESGYEPEFAPRDAEWGERYFHLRAPDGHELSFAAPLGR